MVSHVLVLSLGPAIKIKTYMNENMKGIKPFMSPWTHNPPYKKKIMSSCKHNTIDLQISDIMTHNNIWSREFSYVGVLVEHAVWSNRTILISINHFTA
jgi:hypothetical protein